MGCNAALWPCGNSVPQPEFDNGRSINNCELPIPGQDWFNGESLASSAENLAGVIVVLQTELSVFPLIDGNNIFRPTFCRLIIPFSIWSDFAAHAWLGSYGLLMWTSSLLSSSFSSGIEFCVTLDPKTGWSSVKGNVSLKKEKCTELSFLVSGINLNTNFWTATLLLPCSLGLSFLQKFHHLGMLPLVKACRLTWFRFPYCKRWQFQVFSERTPRLK